MSMYLNTTPDNDILIKSYLKKTSTTELENLILAFKDSYKGIYHISMCFSPGSLPQKYQSFLFIIF